MTSLGRDVSGVFVSFDLFCTSQLHDFHDNLTNHIQKMLKFGVFKNKDSNRFDYSFSPRLLPFPGQCFCLPSLSPSVHFSRFIKRLTQWLTFPGENHGPLAFRRFPFSFTIVETFYSTHRTVTMHLKLFHKPPAPETVPFVDTRNLQQNFFFFNIFPFLQS